MIEHISSSYQQQQLLLLLLILFVPTVNYRLERTNNRPTNRQPTNRPTDHLHIAPPKI